jgi:hypothetical protein
MIREGWSTDGRRVRLGGPVPAGKANG